MYLDICMAFCVVPLQINDADTDEKLRLVFEDDVKLALVCETGYSKALCLASMADKDGIKNALRDYHSLIKIKAELDQFTDGLRTCEVLTYVQNYSDLMQPLFCQQPSLLSKGALNSLNYICHAFILLLLLFL